MAVNADKNVVLRSKVNNYCLMQFDVVIYSFLFDAYLIVPTFEIVFVGISKQRYKN